MAFVTRKTLLTLSVLSAVAVATVGGFIWSGFYNVGADDQHTAPVYALLETMRDRSIQTRASKLQVPDDLQDAARITQGAGNYNAMCMGCHLAPGMAGTEMSRGLYPAPPDLSRATVDAAEAFWVIKHGIKASGMPAWGESMNDEYIWNMAAFVQQLPQLDATEYQAMVDSSGGHDHGGGETAPTSVVAGEPASHPHAAGTPADHHEPAAERVEHRHADGTVESHPTEPAQVDPDSTPASPDAKAAAPADDGHDHQH